MAKHIIISLSFFLLLLGCKSTGENQPASHPTPPPACMACFELPALTEIPDIDLEAYSGGEVFEIETVIVQPGFGNPWDIYLCENEIEDELGRLPKGRIINLELPGEPKPGAIFTQDQSKGGGFFLVRSPGPPSRMITRKTVNTWIVEFTEWEVEPFQPEEDPAQEAGSAAIRLSACFSFDDEIGDSGAAGEFDDVIVRYLGNPN